MWVCLSHRYGVRQKSTYTLVSRATDGVDRMHSRDQRYNNLCKNFSAIVGVARHGSVVRTQITTEPLGDPGREAGLFTLAK